MLTRHGERCAFGVRCTFGQAGKCRGVHTAQEMEIFEMKKKVKEAEDAEACAYCVRRCCWFGARCRRGLRTDSDYESSDDGRMSGERESERNGPLDVLTCQDVTLVDLNLALPV